MTQQHPIDQSRERVWVCLPQFVQKHKVVPMRYPEDEDASSQAQKAVVETQEETDERDDEDEDDDDNEEWEEEDEERDDDGDGVPNVKDVCPDNPERSDGACPCQYLKPNPGICGCEVWEEDSDGDGTPDCVDACPKSSKKWESVGVCGCSTPDVDTDKDGTPDCVDGCANDPLKTAPLKCGCGLADTDSDGDGEPDCTDLCPHDKTKRRPLDCGCGVPETDCSHGSVASLSFLSRIRIPHFNSLVPESRVVVVESPFAIVISLLMLLMVIMLVWRKCRSSSSTPINRGPKSDATLRAFSPGGGGGDRTRTPPSGTLSTPTLQRVASSGNSSISSPERLVRRTSRKGLDDSFSVSNDGGGI